MLLWLGPVAFNEIPLDVCVLSARCERAAGAGDMNNTALHWREGAAGGVEKEKLKELGGALVNGYSLGCAPKQFSWKTNDLSK